MQSPIAVIGKKRTPSTIDVLISCRTGQIQSISRLFPDSLPQLNTQKHLLGDAFSYAAFCGSNSAEGVSFPLSHFGFVPFPFPTYII